MKTYFTTTKSILAILLSLSITLSIQITSYANNDPVFSDGDSTRRTVSENTGRNIAFGDPVSATDDDDDTLTYTLGGTNASHFQLDSTTGQLKTKRALNYENKNSYSVTITVSDGNEGSDTIDVTVRVRDVVDLSTAMSERTVEVKKGIVAAVSGVNSADKIGDSHLKRITTLNLYDKGITSLQNGDFSGLSNLEVLHLSRNKFETLPSDIFDGLTKLEHLFLGDSPLNSLPEDVFEELTSIEQINLKYCSLTTLPSDIFKGLTTLETINLIWNKLRSLPDGLFEGLTSLKSVYLFANPVILDCTVSLIKIDDGEFKAKVHTAAPFDMTLNVSATNGSIDGDVTTITVSKGDITSDTFTVTRPDGSFDAVTVTINNPLPTIPSRHDDGYQIAKSSDLPLTVLDLIDPKPMFTDGSSTTRSVREDTAADRNIGSVLSATPYDSDSTLAYTLSGTDADSFSIDATTGQLKTDAALDYETKTSYSVTVTATDDESFDETYSNTIDVTINVENVNESPQFADESLTFSLDENTESDVNIGDPITATDPDANTTLTYSLSGTDASRFQVDSSTGQLKTNGTLNYEHKSSYSLELTARDDGSPRKSGSIGITINLNDLLDAYVALSERTSEVADAILDVLPDVSSADDIVDSDLQSIEGLILKDKDLSAIKSVDFNGLTGLVTLDLSGNSLSSLPNRSFTGLSALKSLDLSSNEITSLSNNTFTGLRGLESLNLSSNEIASFSETTFDKTRALKILNLSSNEIESVPNQLFWNLRKLENLDLSSNEIDTYSLRIFEDLSALTDLDMSSNKMTRVHKDLFTVSSKLVNLDLSSNEITTLPSDVFDDSSALVTINLSENEINTVEAGAFSGASNLENLDLTDNSLSSFPIGTFTGLSSLKTLNATRNTRDPILLHVKLRKQDGGGVKVEIEQASPYYATVTLNIDNGESTFVQGERTYFGHRIPVEFAPGERFSDTVPVTRAEGKTGAVVVDVFRVAPSIPDDHSGYEITSAFTTDATVFPAEGGAAPANIAELIPDTTEFLPNYPNPFNPETWIPYQLANPSTVQITIYNIGGVVVRHLDLGHQPAGYYTSRSRAAHWDGRNAAGERIASGLYFYRFEADNMSVLRKMVILK